MSSREIMDISTGDQHATAPTFHHQSKALQEAASALKTALDGLGAPWGNDEQGMKFHDAYAPHRTSIAKATAVLVLGLESIGVGMRDMADGHVDNESLVEAMFSKMGKQDAK